MADNQPMNRHPLPVIIGTVVFVVTIVASPHLPWWVVLPVALGSGIMVGFYVPRRWMPVFVVIIVFTAVFTTMFSERADASRGDGCFTSSEWNAFGRTNNIRRAVIEQRYRVRALPVDANDYVDPTNPHLYPVAYRACGLDPFTEVIIVINYRITSDAWVWAFRLNR